MVFTRKCISKGVSSPTYKQIDNSRHVWSWIVQLIEMNQGNCFRTDTFKWRNKLLSYKFQCYLVRIDRFHVTSSLSKIQNQSATKGFIFIRHKRRYIYICLQFYSPIACFVWKPQHFEVQSYGGAWHKATIAFVEKYIPISWFVAFLEVRALEKVFM